MKDLCDRRIGEEPSEIWRARLTFGDADDIDRPVTGRELHEAEAIAAGLQSHRLGIDRREIPVGGEVPEITLMDADVGQDRLRASVFVELGSYQSPTARASGAPAPLPRHLRHSNQLTSPAAGREKQ